MRHFFSTTVRVVLILAIVLSVGLAVLSNLTGQTVPEILVKNVLTPLRAGASALTDQAEQLYDYVFRYETLAAENAALKEELAQLQEASRDYDSMARELERLKKLLELNSKNEDYKEVDAYIITWSSNDWTSTLTVNRGSNDGIQEGMCAITANGEMVGLVTEVGSNYSVIKTILDSSLQISAIIATSGYNGMVTGAYSSDLEGMLRMDYLPSSAIIRNNDQVVTSGSTVYPRDLILGHIVDAGFNDTGVAKYAILEPAADIANLEQVFILTEFDEG